MRSNTPLQALTLLNDEAEVEFAEKLAARVLKEPLPNDAARLRYAFLLTMQREPRPKESARLLQMSRTLLDAGGFRGMVGGQWLDLAAEGRDLDAGQLATIHRGKTGALIRACCELGGIAAGAGPGQMAALTAFGHDVGLAFQVADDVLDATGSSEALGKTAGGDALLAKSTYVSVLGVEEARAEAGRLVEQAVARLQHTGLAAEPLSDLAGFIITRTS